MQTITPPQDKPPILNGRPHGTPQNRDIGDCSPMGGRAPGLSSLISQQVAVGRAMEGEGVEHPTEARLRRSGHAGRVHAASMARVAAL